MLCYVERIQDILVRDLHERGVYWTEYGKLTAASNLELEMGRMRIRG